MATIDIEYLPAEVLRRLQDRADAAEITLPDYVASELTRLAHDDAPESDGAGPSASR